MREREGERERLREIERERERGREREIEGERAVLYLSDYSESSPWLRASGKERRDRWTN